MELGFHLTDSLTQSEQQMKSLRRELEESAGINMTSIEEFETCQTRYDFLNKQLDDLRISREELIEIIEKLAKESRILFQKTFNNIRDHF